MARVLSLIFGKQIGIKSSGVSKGTAAKLIQGHGTLITTVYF